LSCKINGVQFKVYATSEPKWVSYLLKFTIKFKITT
jgi:hypothetical protein